MVSDTDISADEPWRALEAGEAAILDVLLATDFPGRSELAVQARSARVRRFDGEGSLRFQVEGPPAQVRGRVPVEARYHDGSRQGQQRPAVNLLLHVVKGWLHELEIYKDDGSDILIRPFAVPIEHIEVSAN
jgi:hypothetical protein